MNKFTQYLRRDGRVVVRDRTIEAEQVGICITFRGRAYADVVPLKFLLEHPDKLSACITQAVHQLYEGAMDGKIPNEENS